MAFAEDQYKPLTWLTLTGGLRFTHFSSAISENVTDPRIGAASRLPRLNWVLRAFYGRYYQAPPLATVSGPLLEFAAGQGFTFLPLRGERDEEQQFGLAQYAEKGVQLAPKMYAARNVLGRVLLELGQTERAVKELEEGVRLAPSSPEMHFALARAYTRAGRQADAARERELFKQLQEQYNARRGQRAGGDTDDSQPKAKP